jgi:4-diphosphocytidyl-2-C-methyl-D-erythritol kinase
MQTINLHDQLVLEPDKELRVVCHDLPGLDMADNLVWRAAQVFKDRFKVKGGAHIVLYKRIPAGSGLGGGSSDAASTLVGLSQLWKIDPGREALTEMAASLGSDVPFFLTGASAVCRGRGERVEPFHSQGSWCYLLAVPESRNKTSSVYEQLDKSGAYEFMTCRPVVEALKAGDQGKLEKALFNRLEKPALEINGGVGRLLDILGPGSRMTGSGSACFRVCQEEHEARMQKKRLESLLKGHLLFELTADQSQVPQTLNME